MRRVFIATLTSAITLGVLSLVLTGGGVASNAHRAASCGVERWPVKTLSDSREKLVNYKPGVPSA